MGVVIMNHTKQSAAISNIDSVLINQIIEVLYDKMLDDYRINRFFNPTPASEQTGALKILINTLLSGQKYQDQQELLDDYFMAAFARSNAKHSLVTGNDFAFLLDVIGGQEIRTITRICDAHSHLLKLEPDDSNFDVVMEHLDSTLSQLRLDQSIKTQLLNIAESARDPVLGRQQELA
jgi:truncated hemoglobin YjbI